MRRGALVIAVFLALASSVAPAQEREASGIERLEAAVAEHPDDPDLLFALATELAEIGRREEAVEQMRRFVTRWPTERVDASLRLGRWLYELGRDEEALGILERATRLDPNSGLAQLQLGLLYKRLDRFAEADAAFERSAQAEPELRIEALFLRALAQLEDGDTRSGHALLRESIALDPAGDFADRARWLLEDPPQAEPDDSQGFWVQADATFGTEYDGNVTLDSGINLPGLAEDPDDFRFLWGGSLMGGAPLGERTGLAAGARYDQSAHLELSEYDDQNLTGVLSTYAHVGSRTTLRMDGLLFYSILDGDPYLLSGVVRPNAIFSLGRRAGVLRLFAELEPASYRDDPLFSSLERDGIAYGGGFEHYLMLPWRSAWLSLRGGFRRLATDAKRDLQGFASAYDHDRWRGGVKFHVALPWKISADASVSVDYERYRHRNLIDFLTENGVGTLRPSPRRDRVLVGQLSLVRPILRFVDLQLSWSHWDRASNVDFYRYDRPVLGLYLRVHRPEDALRKE